MKFNKLYLLIALIFAALLTLPQVTPVGADVIITIEPDPIDGDPPPTEPPAETSPPEDLALNPSRTGYPHPLESDNGWGGGADKWEIVDGTRRYPDWDYGLAFTGGKRPYIEPCGWRQATINFGEPTTFNRVMVWHHGLEGHVPNTYKIQYYDGVNWVDIFSTTNGHDYLVYPAETPTDWWHNFSTPTENSFNPITSNKVRFNLWNCDIVHGWIYEFEVYYDENQPPVLASDQMDLVVDEGLTINNTGTVNDPDGDALSLSASVGAVSNNSDGTWFWSYTTNDGPIESQTVTISADDGNGGTAQTTFELTVNNVAPTATLENDGPVDEGSNFTLSLTNPSDPSSVDTEAGFSYAFDCDDGSGLTTFTNNSSATCPTIDNTTRVVVGKIKDKDGGASMYDAEVAINNVAPTVGPITGMPEGPIPVDTMVNLSATFSDPGIADTHTALWDWSDGQCDTSVSDPDCSVTETNGSDTTTASHAYNTPGVYGITVTVTDDDNGEGFSIYEFIVVYDPSAGFVTGGGWIMSPAGACQFDACMDDTTGKANFGFVSKYKKGAKTPTGRTEFQFKAGNLDFHSDSYDWLVIAGPNAKYKGAGTINGSGNYGFMLTATDSDVNSGGEVDTFRIMIWDKDNDGQVVYDNKIEASDDSYDGTELGGGNIKVHKGK
jgi:hypothetical protein